MALIHHVPNARCLMPTTYHPEELALLETIHANPRDDAPRLIFSDWLEEHGEEKYAEFIRWQIVRPQETDFTMGRSQLRSHALRFPSPLLQSVVERPDLLEGIELVGPRWVTPFPKIARTGSPNLQFFRGLPNISFHCSVNYTKDLTRVANRLTPALRVCLHFLPSEPLTTLLNHPIWLRCDKLQFWLTNLREVSLEDGLFALKEAGLFERLRSFELCLVGNEPPREFLSLLGKGWVSAESHSPHTILANWLP